MDQIEDQTTESDGNQFVPNMSIDIPDDSQPQAVHVAPFIPELSFDEYEDEDEHFEYEFNLVPTNDYDDDEGKSQIYNDEKTTMIEGELCSREKDDIIEDDPQHFINDEFLPQPGGESEESEARFGNGNTDAHDFTGDGSEDCGELCMLIEKTLEFSPTWFNDLELQTRTY